jgi:hypothetical protein
MNTVAKVAIGCVVAAVGVVVVGVVGVGVAGYWAAGKAKQAVHQMESEQKKITELQEKANSNPFTEPADRTISEPRLIAFLEVRKRVYDVYLKHKAQIDALVQNKDNKGPSLGDLTSGYALINEARQARMQGLADVGMSEAEYAYYVSAIYTSMVGSEVGKATGGKKVSEVVSDSYKKAAKALDEAANATPDPSLPPETQKMMREAQEQARRQRADMDKQAVEAAAEGAKADVPEANIALYRKHEAEIQKYAMAGLEILL